MEKLLRDTPADGLRNFFTDQELADAGTGAGRTGSLAARFAAKEACCKLFPRETALGILGPADFSVRSDGYGAPHIEVSAKARAAMNRAFIGEIRLSLTHTEQSASAVAVVEKRKFNPPWFGKLIYHLLPLRREVVLKNLRRAFSEVLEEEDRAIASIALHIASAHEHNSMVGLGPRAHGGPPRYIRVHAPEKTPQQ
jgi:phosphopantetheine--protein transferase-like protein